MATRISAAFGRNTNNPGYAYDSENDDIKIGDIVRDDCGFEMTVVAIGSDYAGRVRRIPGVVVERDGQRVHIPKRTPLLDDEDD